MHHITEDIVSMVNYDDNNVQSRILAKNDNNLALLIAIKKNQMMAEHTSPVDAFLYVIEGEVEFKVHKEKTETFEIKKGEIFYFEKEEKHTVFGKKDSKILVVRM